MTEAHSSEVERVLLYVGDARDRARIARDQLEKENAEPHVAEAMRAAERALGELHRELSQRTFYAVPENGLKLAV